MAELFGKTKQGVSLHIRNIFKEGELVEETVVKDSLTTAVDGKKYQVTYYILMFLFLSAAGSSRCAAPNFAPGQPRFCVIILSVYQVDVGTKDTCC